MTKTQTVPKFVRHKYGGRTRDFRAAKRRQAREAEQALQALFLGFAYLPREVYQLVCNMRSDLKRVRRLCSVKEWGR